MAFWVDWALWQKMSFVRHSGHAHGAGRMLREDTGARVSRRKQSPLQRSLRLLTANPKAIVLVYSFGALIRNKRTTKKHAAADACRKAEDQVEHDWSLARPAVVLFGARALESGIFVDGIWVSGSNTPVPSPCQPATPCASRQPSPARCPTPSLATALGTTGDRFLQTPLLTAASVPLPPLCRLEQTQRVNGQRNVSAAMQTAPDAEAVEPPQRKLRRSTLRSKKPFWHVTTLTAMTALS